MPRNKRVLIDSELATVLASSIDTSHPLPIYLQIASTIEREIATGGLAVGAVLPSVRSLAAALGVHYHTIRHAWDTLVEAGVLSVRRGRGARVVGVPSAPASWQLTPSGPEVAGHPVVWVVSPVWRHAAAIARQLMDRWALVAAPWPIGGHLPPPGVVLMLDGARPPERWAARRPDQHSLPTALPRDAVSRIRRAATLLDTREVRIITTASLGDDATLLARQLPRLGLTVVPGLEAGATILPDGDRRVVVTDMGSDELATGGDPRVLVLDRSPAAGPLAGLARELGWQPM